MASVNVTGTRSASKWPTFSLMYVSLQTLRSNSTPPRTTRMDTFQPFGFVSRSLRCLACLPVRELCYVARVLYS